MRRKSLLNLSGVVRCRESVCICDRTSECIGGI